MELPGSAPLVFEGGRSIGTRLVSWPPEQVVKCLVRLHPDEPVEDRLEQETQLLALHDAVQASGHELLLEVIPPRRWPVDADTTVRAPAAHLQPRHPPRVVEARPHVAPRPGSGWTR